MFAFNNVDAMFESEEGVDVTLGLGGVSQRRQVVVFDNQATRTTCTDTSRCRLDWQRGSIVPTMGSLLTVERESRFEEEAEEEDGFGVPSRSICQVLLLRVEYITNFPFGSKMKSVERFSLP